jgi:hypothetical protein
LSDWDEVVQLLKQEFLPPDFDELLWDEIKGRLQGKSESITIYVAVMETLFARLSRPRRDNQGKDDSEEFASMLP